MQVESYSYQTPSKKYKTLEIENNQLKLLLQDVKRILEGLYKDKSKVKVCLETIEKYGAL